MTVWRWEVGVGGGEREMKRGRKKESVLGGEEQGQAADRGERQRGRKDLDHPEMAQKCSNH